MSIYGLFPALFLLQCVFVRVLFSCTPFFLATLSLARLGTLLTNGSCAWGFFGPLVWALRPKGGFLGHNNEFQDEGGGGSAKIPAVPFQSDYRWKQEVYELGELLSAWPATRSAPLSNRHVTHRLKNLYSDHQEDTLLAKKASNKHPLLSDHIF